MKKTCKLLSLILALVLVFGVMPLAAFAASSNDDGTVKVTSVKITTSINTLNIGRTQVLKASVRPTDADDTVYWETSDEDIIEIEEDGVRCTIRARKPGVATITAYGNNSRKDSVEVTVPGNGFTAPNVDSDGRDLDNSISSSKSSSSSKAAATATVDGEKLASATVTSAVKTAVQKSKNAAVTFSNASSVSAATLQAAAKTATDAGGKVTLNFDTTVNKAVKGRLTVDPAAAAKLTSDIALGVHVSEEATSAVVSKFEKNYSNDFTVIKCDQKGSYGMAVSIAAKADLSGMSTKNLKFYSYNSTKNTIAEITEPSYSVDKNGYLRFTTTTGYYIIVSDGKLAK